ncbi:MAG: hypothetical protein OHK0017_02460 [Patescibacteria group bacterium]
MAVLTKLPYPEIVAELKSLSGWTYWNGSLMKTFDFRNFGEVTRFMVKIKAFCGSAQHYPQIIIQPSKNSDEVSVKITTTTFAAGSEVTTLDIQMAQALNKGALEIEITPDSDYQIDQIR